MSASSVVAYAFRVYYNACLDNSERYTFFWRIFFLNDGALRAPEPLPILNPSNFVPKNGFPVVKALRSPKSSEKYAIFLFLRDSR